MHVRTFLARLVSAMRRFIRYDREPDTREVSRELVDDGFYCILTKCGRSINSLTRPEE